MAWVFLDRGNRKGADAISEKRDKGHKKGQCCACDGCVQGARCYTYSACLYYRCMFSSVTPVYSSYLIESL